MRLPDPLTKLERDRARPGCAPARTSTVTPEAAAAIGRDQDPNLPPSFLRLAPPEHDRLRRLAMRPFGPPYTPRRVFDRHGELADIVSGLADGLRGRDSIDLVDDFSYPFPVTVICRILGSRAPTSRTSTSGPTPSPPASTRSARPRSARPRCRRSAGRRANSPSIWRG